MAISGKARERPRCEESMRFKVAIPDLGRGVEKRVASFAGNDALDLVRLRSSMLIHSNITREACPCAVHHETANNICGYQPGVLYARADQDHKRCKG